MVGQNGVLGIFGPLPCAGSDSRAVASLDGNYIMRVPLEPPPVIWSHNAVLLGIHTDSVSIRNLALPDRNEGAPSFVRARSLAFSQDGIHVGAFDHHTAHVWLVQTGAHVAWYDVNNPFNWIAHFNVSSFTPTNIKISFYPPRDSSTMLGAKPTGYLRSAGDSPASITLPELPSSIFFEISDSQRNSYLEASRALGPTCFTTNGYDVFFDGKQIWLHGTINPYPRGRLRYSIHKGRVRVLLGGGPAGDPLKGGSNKLDNGGILLLPPLTLEFPQFRDPVS